MSIYANLSDKMALPSSTGTPVDLGGSIFFAFGNLSFQTVRRKRKNSFQNHNHLDNYIFDPQLYLADLNFNECSNVCTKLSSYSWFNVNVPKFDSQVMKQSEWKTSAFDEVKTQWMGKPSTDSEKINKYAKDCLFYQREIGCKALIAPAPTTFSVSSDYSQELEWLNATRRVKKESGFNEPLYATVALSTPLFSHGDTEIDRCLSSIANAITARRFDGVYLVFCQTGDYGNSKHPTNEKALFHILKFIELLKKSDPAPEIIVNGVGFFGIACQVVGADSIGIGWYRKQYRIHLADFADAQMVFNRAGDLVSTHKTYPKYWTSKVMGDIGIPNNFDKLVSNGYLEQIEDETAACQDLLSIARNGTSVREVDAWLYKPSNVTATREHYLQSCIKADRELSKINPADRLTYMKNKFETAVMLETEVIEILRSTSTSNLDHVSAWQKAFERYLTSQ